MRCTNGNVRAGMLVVRFVAAIALSAVIGQTLPLAVATVGAEAPALATVRYDAPLLEAPDSGSDIIRMVSEGTDVEITGHNAIGYLMVIADGETGWMSADSLTISGAGPVSTAASPNGASIFSAPLPDASVLGEVPAGGVVIVTGAHVDIYVAGSYDGVGGWMIESDLDLPYDADSHGR